MGQEVIFVDLGIILGGIWLLCAIFSWIGFWVCEDCFVQLLLVRVGDFFSMCAIFCFVRIQYVEV